MEQRSFLQKITPATFIIFILLLVIRFSSLAFLPLTPNREPSAWLYYLWYSGGYLLIGIVIWINRDNLKKINIDVFFVTLFIFAGSVVTIFAPVVIGIFTACMTVSVLYIAYQGKFKFEKDVLPGYWYKVIPILVGFTFCCLQFSDYEIQICQTHPTQLTTFLFLLPDAAYEEIIFRSLFWMFLKMQRLSDRKIIFAQTVAFWLAHLNYYYSHPISFWFYVPLFGLLLGLVVQRSKSIAWSTSAHLVINIVIIFFREYLCLS